MRSILLLTIFLIQKIESEPPELIAYNECVQFRASNISKSLHLNAIICIPNEKCVLKSNNCPNPFQTLNTTWFKDSTLISLNTRKYDSNNSNDLVINTVDQTDEGYYREIIYNKTIINEYHITVQSKSNYYPIYEKDFKENKSYLLNTIEIKTEWTQWSDCKCSQKGKKMYRIRFGNCFLIKSNEAQLPKNLNHLFKYYKKALPCESKLINYSFKKVNFLMFGDCYSTCNKTLTRELNLNIKTNYWNGQRIQTVYGQLGKVTQLDCDLQLTRNSYDFISTLNIKWKFKDQEYKFDLKQNTFKTFVDKYHRLTIKLANYYDTGNYSCFYNNEIKKIVLFHVVDNEIKSSIYKFSIHFGCALVCVTLFLVNIFVCLQRKELKLKSL